MSQLVNLRGIVPGHRTLRTLINTLAFAALSATLLGCGGGSSGSAPAAEVGVETATPEEGELLIGLTDAEGDYLTYAVAVDSLLLERRNGDTVQALPLATSVDFTELTEVTEFLTVATVPAGTYESVTLRLDYSNAQIVVQDETGNALEAIAVDAEGEPISTLDVKLNLPATDLIRISRGRPAAFSLDFDLDASNEIDFSTTPVRVIVEPFLLATAALEQNRTHRVRGVLASVDTEAAAVTLKVRPFRHRQGDFGTLSFGTDENTRYEINGMLFDGEAGLEALATLSENTPLVAGLQIDGDGRVATTVLAGSSVPWANADVVKGVIYARDGDRLTVRGAAVSFSNGTHAFRDTITVSVSADTMVTALGTDGGSKTAQSLSVGQRITAFGELTEQSQLDATAGRIRMQQNQLIAEVSTPNPLVVDLHLLNGRRPEAFDFSGTGVDDTNHADPDAYEIDSGALDLAAFEPGDLVRVRGLVNDFGLAPPDFRATTLIDIDSEARGASFKARWLPAEPLPFDSIEPAAVALDLEAARTLLRLRGIPVRLTNPVTALTLLAPDNGNGIYAVRTRGDGNELHLFRSFAELVTELTAQLDAGAELARLHVHGSYSSDSDSLTAQRASFTFRAAALP